MNFDLQRLYELLPAFYRLRDAEIGRQQKGRSGDGSEIHEPLKALLSIIADEVAVIEENLDQLYDDQFIETCAEWVIPYIGQLIGTSTLAEMPGTSFSRRSEVANTIKYRRRKGTASVLEQLARDVTGWDANVVEYFKLLSISQFMNHIRPKNLTVASVRNWKELEYANTPFDTMAHTLDVRRVENQQGKYNIPNVGIHLWRLKNYASTQSPAFKVDDRRYTFDPLGKNIPLYNNPVPEETITQLAAPINVPMPIARRVLKEHLENYYGEGKSIMLYIHDEAWLPEKSALLLNNPPNPPASTLEEIICVCNLHDLYDEEGNVTGWGNMPEDKVGIDPVLGRITLPMDLNNLEEVDLKVSYQYGFSSELGGGEYDRADTFAARLVPIEPVKENNLIQEAIDKLQETGGIIEIKANAAFREALNIRIAKGKTLEIRAADKHHPILYGGLQIEEDALAGRLILNGLLLTEGDIQVAATSTLTNLRLVHCTVDPSSLSKITVASPNTSLEIEKSIIGSLEIVNGAQAHIRDSIIDATFQQESAYGGLSFGEPGGTLRVLNSTFIGQVHTMMMELASNTIFMAKANPLADELPPVISQRLQQGCVRFSYFPLEAKLPSPYRCQPTTITDADRVRPTFTSLHYGDPGYCQLSQHCAAEITAGADDESEMGAFHHLYQPQRISNLRLRLNEYLRLGLEAGIFCVS